MQSSESLGVLRLIFPSAPVVQGWTTACDWLEAPLLGHSPCHRFIESCPQGVLRTIRVVIQPESSGWSFVCVIIMCETNSFGPINTSLSLSLSLCSPLSPFPLLFLPPPLPSPVQDKCPIYVTEREGH